MCRRSRTGKLYRSSINVPKSLPWSVLRRCTWQTGWGETLDYIIFGLGVGATLTLVGGSFRMWGSALRDRSSSPEERVLSGYELVNRMAWRRFCRSCGTILAIFGLLVLVATTIATALMLSNRTGTTIVLTTCGVSLIATFVWLGLFLHRFGARGIIRPKAARPVSAPAPAPLAARSGDTSAGTVASDLIGPPVPAGIPSMADTGAEPSSETFEDDRPASDEPDTVTVAPTPDPVLERDAASREPRVDPGGKGPDVEGNEIGHEAKASDPPMLPSEETTVPTNDVAEDENGKEAGTSNVVYQSTTLVSEKGDGAVSSTTHDAEQVPESPQTTDADDDAPHDTAVAEGGAGVYPDDGVDPATAEDSGADPEVDEDRSRDVEGPSSSGRAEAVRSLRQRRMKRRTQRSSEPE